MAAAAAAAIINFPIRKIFKSSQQYAVVRVRTHY